MRKRERPKPHSLRVPDHLDPPAEVAKADQAYGEAIAKSRATVEAVQKSRAAAREAKARDVKPSELRKLTEAAEDAEHSYRAAKRAEAEAKEALAQAIERNRDALRDQLEIAAKADEALAKVAEADAAIRTLAELAGSAQTLANIDRERTRSRGFEPIRSQADRFNTPQAHVAALEAWANELREIGERTSVESREVAA